MNTCIAVGQQVLKTTDGGTSWVTLDELTDDSLNSIHCVEDSNICYAATSKGIIRKTIDGGNNWILQNEGEHIYGLRFILCPSDETTCYAVGGYPTGGITTILQTSDGVAYMINI